MTDSLPYVRGSDTSEAAAVAKQPTAARQREYVYAVLRERGGMTQEQLSDLTRLSGDSVRPRLVELRAEGRVVDGGRRLTRAGRFAVVWLAIEQPVAAEDAGQLVMPW